ncbi:MAG: hypothetical protein [Bacteriophage sp.]|nr:MAG: hypothetical protein [Bacteriophage sp.]
MRLNFNEYDENLRAQFDEDSVKLAGFARLCADVARHSVLTVDPAKAEKEIRDNILAIYGLDENPTNRQISKALRYHDKNIAVFQIIEEVIEDTLVSGWQSDAFFQTLVETKNGRIGDTNSFFIPDDTVISISKINNGHHDMIRQRLGEGREIPIETSSIGAKVYMSMHRYLQAAEDWSRLVAEIAKALTNQVNTMIHQQFVTAGKNLPEAKWYAGGKMEAAQHDNFIRLISDVQLATGNPARIIGTKLALSQLKNLGDVVWIAEQAKNDIYSMGRLGSFEGTEIVELPNAFAPNSVERYQEDDKNLYIMPINMDKPIKFYWEGDTEIYEVTDPATRQDKSMDYELAATCGCSVVTGKRFGTWVISE